MRHLLRFIVFNVGLALVMAYLALEGYVQRLFLEDQSYITWGIGGLFVFGLVATAYEVVGVSRTLEEPAAHAPDDLRYMMTHGDKSFRRQVVVDRWLSRIGYVHTLASLLTYLGLIGTITGFVIAFNSIDAQSISVDNLTNLIAQVLGGLKVAFYTTLAGAVTAAWTEVNFRILRTGTQRLVHDICRMV